MQGYVNPCTYAIHMQIHNGWQYMNSGLDAQVMINELISEIHTQHGVEDPITVECVFIVQNSDVRQDLENQVLSYFADFNAGIQLRERLENE